MGRSMKPYKELRKLMDDHGFRLLEIARDGRERWVGLKWTEDHPLVLRPSSLAPHVSVKLQRDITEAAGLETVAAARKRNPAAIKARQAAERERKRAAEEAAQAERDRIASEKQTISEDITAVLTRRTAKQITAEAHASEWLSEEERRARREARRREAELNEIDRLMRESPRGR